MGTSNHVSFLVFSFGTSGTSHVVNPMPQATTILGMVYTIPPIKNGDFGDGSLLSF
jgi:hypothetical protein